MVHKVDNKERFTHQDIIILVTGLVGSGKSTFVNAVLGHPERMAVGETLTSTTKGIDYESVDTPSSSQISNLKGRLIIVDTPGFLDGAANDKKTLLSIVDWLKKRGATNIAGALYLYDIFPERYSIPSRFNLAALRTSFQGSKETFSRVALVTTKWDKMDQAEKKKGEAREKELHSTFWKDLIHGGSHVARFIGTTESARGIVSQFLSSTGQAPLSDMQPRLITLRKYLKKDEAISYTILQFVRGIFD